MKRKSVLIVALAMLLCQACSFRHNDYSDFQTFDKAEWPFTDTVVFVPNIDDSIATGNLSICVRHSDAYLYSNLWLEFEYATSDTTSSIDTLELTLSDDFGHWYGNGSGVSYQYTDTISHRFRLFNGRPLKLRNIMRRDTLQNIEQIGLIFDSHKPSVK